MHLSSVRHIHRKLNSSCGGDRKCNLMDIDDNDGNDDDHHNNDDDDDLSYDSVNLQILHGSGSGLYLIENSDDDDNENDDDDDGDGNDCGYKSYFI